MNNEIRTRFEARAVRKEGCWGWIGSIDVHGYGYVSYLTKKLKAHRVAYELYKGEIPAGLVVDHLCHNRICVNPDHLEPTTIAENVKRGFALITHCIHGHEYTPDNTYKYKRRHCRICTLSQQKAAYHAKNARGTTTLH